MSKLWKVLLVLALGVTLDVPVPAKTAGSGFGFDGPGMAIFVYAIVALVTATSVLNHLPGVFALERPLGVVRSGYEYLWLPVIFANVWGFAYTGQIEGRAWDDNPTWTLAYGSGAGNWKPVIALGIFVVLMWLLKLRASMIKANEQLEQA